MPYRRLPNTDSSRIKALSMAIEKASGTDFQEVALSMKTLSEAKHIAQSFEKICSRYQQTYNTQIKANKTFQQKVKNAKMYISHFIQVLYMCVQRCEIKEEQLALYGLESCNMLLPDLTSNDTLLDWGARIVQGENIRISNGEVPIYNPSIAKVNVMYTLFKESYQTQKIHQKATARMLQEVGSARDNVDSIILKVWDEVEAYHAALPAGARIKRNRQYGVVYYYRKGEAVE